MIDSLIQETSQRLNDALRYAEETQCVLIGENILGETPRCLNDFFIGEDENTSFSLIVDPNTYQAAGKDVEAAIRTDASVNLSDAFFFGAEEFHTDSGGIEKVRTFLSEKSTIPVAVGSGTINDIVKRAAFELQRPYMIVATAASMDGYTSFGAAVDVDGFKQTLSCPAPRVVLLDLDILSAAPPEMSAAGYADLLAKIPAGADWMLADFIGTEPIHPRGWALVQDHLRDWLADPAGIPSGDKAAICRLSEGLIMSGLAMQVARTSRTASGAEHLFSHLWDNQNHQFQGKIPSHGFKVGIGSLASSFLYESVLKLSVADLQAAKERFLADPERRNWTVIEKEIDENFGFGPLGTQIKQQSREKYADAEEKRRRFDLYIAHWDELKTRLSTQLLPAVEIRNMLHQSGAPTKPEEIGIERPRLQRSYELAQLIRCRYNILDFARETECFEQLVPALFENGGPWG